MTIIFPDASEYNGSMPDAPLQVARATIGAVKDTRYDTFRALAAQRGRLFLAYAFLNHDALTLTPTSGGSGVPAERQADSAYAVIGSTPCMLDWEPNRGTCATPAMAWRFINRYRSRGGVLRMLYLPRWVWNQLGQPDLRPFWAAGLHLVSSNYTAYSDTGPGWNPYGGVTPDQWQFTNNWQGSGCDGNAYRGTVQEYQTMITGTPHQETTMSFPATDGVNYYLCDGITSRRIDTTDPGVLSGITALSSEGLLGGGGNIRGGWNPESFGHLVTPPAPAGTPSGTLHVTGDLTVTAPSTS